MLDREAKDRYDVELLCEDAGVPSFQTRSILRVSVLDANDHAPRFSSTLYTARITENNNVGTSVIHLTVSDEDLGVNANCHFLISPLHSDLISATVWDVDAHGVVYAKASVDREQQSNYRFVVIAVDHGKPPLTGSTTVVVIIDDVNDETPVFSHSAYSFSVDENLQGGTVVGTVTAEDKDVGVTSSTLGEVVSGLVFSLSADQLTKLRFSIESQYFIFVSNFETYNTDA